MLRSTKFLFSPLCLSLLVACASTEPPRPRVVQDLDKVAGSGGADSSGDLTVADDPNGSEPGWGIIDQKVSYGDVIRKVTGMVNDPSLSEAVTNRGLNLINLTWEDTGRSMGSAVGPNISDLTLQVRYTEEGQRKAALLPVIRFPNFSDRTGDIAADKFFVRIGNQKKNGKLETVPLTDVLKNVRGFLSEPNSVLGSGNLLAKRDTHFLVSAQAVFLPIPKQGHAEFTPVLFNYQSFPESPAVLTLLVTRQGTSITVIENKGDEQSPVASWGQELFFNKGGERAPFSAERKSDVETRIEKQGGPKTEDDKSAVARGADTLFIVQIPLRQKARPRPMDVSSMGALGGASPAPAAPPQEMMADEGKAERSNVEQAVLGHGKVEGKFFEGRKLKLERDDRFPVRITIQFYKATSNGVVDQKDLDRIASSIGNVYEHADFVGSLVIPEDDARRPTAWQNMPAGWFPF